MGAAFCSVCGTPVQQAPQPTVQQQPGGIPPQTAVPPQGIYQQPAYISPQGFQQQPGAVPPQGAVPSQGIQTHGNVRPQGAFSAQQGYSQQLGYVPPQGFPQQPPQGFQQQYVPPQGFPQQQPQGFQQQLAFIPPRGPQQQPCAVPSAPPAPKRFKIFLIFWFWLGWFGAHDFYAGFIGRGVIHVCIVIAAVISALFSFDIGVSLLSLANFIWLITEIVNALNKKKDANGNIMIEFDQTQPSVDGTQTGKSFKTYLLFGVFLGLLGIHDFYAGYIRLGLMHVWLFIVGSVIDVILYAVTTLPLIVFGLIHTIWLTIELASMLDKKKDMKGNIMKEFQQTS